MNKVKVARNALIVATLVFAVVATFSQVRVCMEDAKYGYKGDGHCADPKPTAYNYLRLELFILDYAPRVIVGLGVLWTALVLYMMFRKPKEAVELAVTG